LLTTTFTTPRNSVTYLAAKLSLTRNMSMHLLLRLFALILI